MHAVWTRQVIGTTFLVVATGGCFSTSHMAGARQLDCPLAAVSTQELGRDHAEVRYHVEGCGREAKLACAVDASGDLTGRCIREREEAPPPSSLPQLVGSPQRERQPASKWQPVGPPTRQEQTQPSPRRSHKATASEACLNGRRAVAAFAAGRVVDDLSRAEFDELARRATKLAKETGIPIEAIAVDDVVNWIPGPDEHPFTAVIGVGIAWVTSEEGQGRTSWRTIRVPHQQLERGLHTAESITADMWKAFDGIGHTYTEESGVFAMVCGALAFAKVWLPDGGETFVQQEGPPYRAITIEPGAYRVRVQYD